jgi:hypothetical protein
MLTKLSAMTLKPPSGACRHSPCSGSGRLAGLALADHFDRWF